jgi:hypothetical protein
LADLLQVSRIRKGAAINSKLRRTLAFLEFVMNHFRTCIVVSRYGGGKHATAVCQEEWPPSYLFRVKTAKSYEKVAALRFQADYF